MNTQLITVENTALSRISHRATPVLFAGSDETETKFWEFFTAHIRNPNTRMAYLMAAYRFADWCETGGLALEKVKPMVVAAYIEQLTKIYVPATVKQHLAAIRLLFDWLVVGQVVPFNPASSVRGPKHVVKTGKTPVLTTVHRTYRRARRLSLILDNYIIHNGRFQAIATPGAGHLNRLAARYGGRIFPERTGSAESGRNCALSALSNASRICCSARRAWSRSASAFDKYRGSIQWRFESPWSLCRRLNDSISLTLYR